MTTFQNKSEFYTHKWDSEAYREGVLTQYKIVEQYLDSIGHNINKLCDIGCGWATSSIYFQKKYNCESYLLEGDAESAPIPEVSRTNGWGTTDTMSFYFPLSSLQPIWEQQGLRYTWVNPLKLKKVDPSIKFDLIISTLSCGYHYPIATYGNFIKQHSHDKTVVIMDLRNKANTCERQGIDYEVVAKLDDGTRTKKGRYHIRLL